MNLLNNKRINPLIRIYLSNKNFRERFEGFSPTFYESWLIFAEEAHEFVSAEKGLHKYQEAADVLYTFVGLILTYIRNGSSDVQDDELLKFDELISTIISCHPEFTQLWSRLLWHANSEEPTLSKIERELWITENDKVRSLAQYPHHFYAITDLAINLFYQNSEVEFSKKIEELVQFPNSLLLENISKFPKLHITIAYDIVLLVLADLIYQEMRYSPSLLCDMREGKTLTQKDLELFRDIELLVRDSIYHAVLYVCEKNDMKNNESHKVVDGKVRRRH